MADTDTAQKGNNGLLKKALGGLNLGGFDPEAYGSLVEQESEAKGEYAKAEQEQKRIAAQGKATAEQSYATGLRQKYAAAEPTLMAAPPKFNVNKDTQEGLTGMAALMTVGSMIIGSKGAMSGVNAMNAMTGVLKGYQEGNQQRIDFEIKKYEQSIKDWERTLQQTKESLSRYEKLASADLSAATAQAAAEAASKGQDVIAAKIKQEGITQTKAMVDKLISQTIENKARMDRAIPKAQRPIPVQREGEQPYLMDPVTRQPVLDAEGNVLRPAPRATAAGQNAQVFASRVSGNIENASQDLINIANSPETSKTPIIAGLVNSDPTTVLGSLKAAAIRTITPEEQRVFDQLSQQMGTALSRLEAQGLASGSTKSQIAGFDALRPKAGDSAINMALYLAKVRQEIETGAKVHANMPGANAGQKQDAQESLRKIRKAVPFTVEDVLNAIRDNQETLSESSRKLLQQRGIATGLQMGADQTDAPTPVTPSGSESVPTFATEQEANDALKRSGKKVGDKVRVRINGVTGMFEVE